MKKKMISLLLVLALVVGVCPVAFAADVAEDMQGVLKEETLEQPIVEPSVVVFNPISMEYIETDYEVKKCETTQLSEDTYAVTCEVTAHTPSIAPCASDGGTYNDGAITASLTIVYSLRSFGNEILITRVYGGWTGLIGQLKNQEVGVTDGAGPYGVGAKSEYWHPTGFSFDYSTGWTEYVLKYPASTDAMAGPRAYCETNYQLSGMGGGIWPSIFLTVKVS